MLKSKRILLISFVLLLLLILPTVVNATTTEATETTATSTGVKVTWSYEISGTSATNLKCTNISSVTGSLTIPSTIDGYTVTSIGSYAFSYCYGLTSVTIPDSVTSIGSYAFSYCSGLTSVTIPDSVTSMDGDVFFGCSALSAVTLSCNLSRISSYTFYGCTALTEIELPSNITTIEYKAFYCKNLKYIKIQENAVSIDSGAFSAYATDLTIYGVEGSVAQTYAEENDINFESIDNWEERYGLNSGDDNNDGKQIDITRYISFPIMIVNGNGTLTLKTGVYDGKYTMYYQFVEVSDKVYSNLESLKEQYENGEITYEKFLTEFNNTVTQYNESNWTKTEDGSFEQDLSQFTGTKKFALWVKLEMEDKTVYEVEVYTMSGSGSATSNDTNSTDKTGNGNSTTNTTDKTIATSNLPNTGKVILVWSIAIVTISGTIAYIRYKM